MKLLLVHQIHERRGGAARLLLDLEALLKEHGDDVTVFASGTEASRESGVHLVRSFNRGSFERGGRLERLRWAARGIYSFDARRALRDLVRETRPDAAIVLKPEYQLTPAVLSELTALRIPTVQWHVDFKPWCTQGQFYNVALEAPCTRCAGGNHVPAIRYRCDLGSRALSIYGAVARTVTTTLLRIPWSADAYVVPAEVTRRLLGELVGLPLERTFVVRHAFKPDDYEPAPAGGTGPILFFGGVSPLKGVWTLVRALRSLVGVRIFIAGIDDGGMRPRLEALVDELGLRERVQIDTAIRMGPELKRLICEAPVVVAPSEWYDTVEYSVVEAMAMAKPVIVGNRGGNAEVVEDGVSGFRVPSADPEALAARIRSALADPGGLARIGVAARARVRALFDPDTFYRQVHRAVAAARARSGR